LLGDEDRAIVALDIPFSWPPEPVNGCLIAGYGAPAGDDVVFTYPESLRAELTDRYGECEVAVPRMKAAPPREALFRKWDAIIENRRRVAGHFLRTADWDVFMIVLGVTDHMQHGAWTYFDPLHADSKKPEAERFREVLFKYYEKADSFIGHLLDIAGGRLNVLVLSDHGFGTTWNARLTRQVLIESGWLRYRGAGAGQRAIEWMRRRYDSMPWLKRFLHKRPQDRARLKRALAGAIDWPQTAAFPASMGWQVFVNRVGDFPQGTVQPGEPSASLCERIGRKLESVKLPGTDRSVVRKAYRRDEIYTGGAMEHAPDLFLEYQNLYGMKVGGDPAGWDLVGSHAMNGIFIASGPDLRAARIEGAEIIDLAPTILHLAGLAVPDDMDGKVLTDALRPETLQERPIKTRPVAKSGDDDESKRRGLDESDEERIREQLRNLGYID
jgi:predicted AlkP superfamily phosphohydrolase/phosphomutase